MNKDILIGLSFMAGAVIGVAASMRYFKKKYSEEAKEEINKVMEDYRTRMADISEDETEAVDEPTEVIKSFSYDTIDTVTVKNVDEHRDAANTGVYEPDVAPYPINMDSFISDHNEFDKITYKYYTEDKVLCDEEGQVVNIDETVTQDLLDIYGKSSLDTFYVRNPKIYTDYEIERIDSEYSIEYGVYDE